MLSNEIPYQTINQYRDSALFYLLRFRDNNHVIIIICFFVKEIRLICADTQSIWLNLRYIFLSLYFELCWIAAIKRINLFKTTRIYMLHLAKIDFLIANSDRAYLSFFFALERVWRLIVSIAFARNIVTQICCVLRINASQKNRDNTHKFSRSRILCVTLDV